MITRQVPIWCCVLNRLAAPEEEAGCVSDGTLGACERDGGTPVRGRGRGAATAWDTALHTPRFVHRFRSPDVALV